jgi:hypothetical protein
MGERVTNMQRALRAVPAAVLALVACLALAGCRSQPGVAAYVGNERLTEARVDETVENAAAQSRTPDEQGTKPPTRSDVVTTWVLGKVCEQLRAKQGFAKAPITVERVRQAEGVPASSAYARDRANLYSCLGGVKLTNAGAVTDAELRELYDRAQAAGLVNQPFDKVKAQLAGNTNIQQALAADRILSGAVRDGDVTVNPRYRPMEFPITDLGTGRGPLIGVLLGEPGSDAVRDVN